MIPYTHSQSDHRAFQGEGGGMSSTGPRQSAWSRSSWAAVHLLETKLGAERPHKKPGRMEAAALVVNHQWRCKVSPDVCGSKTTGTIRTGRFGCCIKKKEITMSYRQRKPQKKNHKVLIVVNKLAAVVWGIHLLIYVLKCIWTVTHSLLDCKWIFECAMCCLTDVQHSSAFGLRCKHIVSDLKCNKQSVFNQQSKW